ncbi:MAG: carbohydrate kinase family protein [Isosphaeraceae bacterium]
MPATRGPTENPPIAGTFPAVVCAGMVVIDHVTPPLDRLPRSGELVSVEHLVLSTGGGAANTAVDLARLGVPVRLCARVGDDIFGRFAALTLVAHGVDTMALHVDINHETSQTLIVNVRGEDRRFIHCLGANRAFNPADLDAILDPPPGVLHIGYFLLMPGLDAAGLAERLARARQLGTITLVDVATPGPGNYLEPLRAVLPHTDVFVPNTDEAALILGEDDPVRQAFAFHEMGAGRVVITRGERGLVSVSDQHRVAMPAFSVPFIDGTGGGDAFNAGYLVGMLEGRSELDCLKLASAVGASCIRAIGATAGVFTRAEADDFLSRYDLPVHPLQRA